MLGYIAAVRLLYEGVFLDAEWTLRTYNAGILFFSHRVTTREKLINKLANAPVLPRLRRVLQLDHFEPLWRRTLLVLALNYILQAEPRQLKVLALAVFCVIRVQQRRGVVGAGGPRTAEVIGFR